MITLVTSREFWIKAHDMTGCNATLTRFSATTTRFHATWMDFDERLEKWTRNSGWWYLWQDWTRNQQDETQKRWDRTKTSDEWYMWQNSTQHQRDRTSNWWLIICVTESNAILTRLKDKPAKSGWDPLSLQNIRMNVRMIEDLKWHMWLNEWSETRGWSCWTMNSFFRDSCDEWIDLHPRCEATS